MIDDSAGRAGATDPQRVFLAGATGVVGLPAMAALVADGHRVTAVARSPEKAEAVRRAGATPVSVDLFDPAAVEVAVQDHDVVVNLATNIPPLTRAARSSAWATNDRLRREGARNLVDAALAAGARRYVQESIAFAYVDAGDALVDEDAPVTHVGPFAAAGDAEAHAARFERAGGTGVVLRFAQFYAAGSRHTEDFSRLLRLRVNPFVGPPEAFTSSIHAEDAGAAVAAALRAPGGTFNVVDDEPLTRREAGRAAAARMGLAPPREVPKAIQALLPSSAKLLMRSLRESNRRFRDATGWAPGYPSIAHGWPEVGR